MTNPLVSVVVPTRNSASSLDRALGAISSQNYKNIEILVIDNNSSDKTKGVALKYTDKVFNFGPERTAQVNFGIKKSSGKYIYYTGSDVETSKDMIVKAVAKCEEEGSDAVYTNVVTKIKNPNVWQAVRALERTLYEYEPGMSAARFFRKDVFEKLGGYDEKLGGVSDDLEFQYRLDEAGYKTAFIDQFENNFGEYDSLGIIIKRALYYGWLLDRTFKKHPEHSKKQYSPVRKEFKNKIVLYNDKKLFFFFIVYKFSQYLFGGIGLVLSRLTKSNKRIEKYFFRLNYGS